MREILTLHLGQAGLNLGSTCWEVFRQEIQGDTAPSDVSRMWLQLSDQQYCPRAVFVDSDRETADEVRCREVGRWMRPHQVVSEWGGEERNLGRRLADRTMEEIRRLSEECDSVGGAFIFHSISGSTGSHLSELLCPELTSQLHHLHSINIFPSGDKTESSLSPYTSCLSAHHLIEHTSLSYIVDNKALRGIARESLGEESPENGCLNELVAQAISTLTTSLRFDGCLNTEMVEFVSNLIPYPRLHTCLLSHSPYYSSSSPYYSHTTTGKISTLVFRPASCLASCDQLTGLYMSCAMHYRGYIIPKEVGYAVGKLKTNRTIQFVDWSPAGFKCGIAYSPPAVLQGGSLEVTPRSVLVVSNNTAVKSRYQYIVNRAKKVLKRKTFWHHMKREDTEISEAVEGLNSVIGDYVEIETPPSEES